MRILYVGDLRRETTSYSRYVALQETENALNPFATYEICASPNRILNTMGHRYYCTRAVWLGNARLRRLVEKTRPELLWIDKGRWIYPSTLHAVRATGAKLVHYNTDDIYDPEGYAWLHRLGIKYYDLCITTNRFNVHDFRSQYGVDAFRAGMGYDSELHKRPDGANALTTPDIIFVGHWEVHTEVYLTALVDNGFAVEIYGGNWRRSRRQEFRSAHPLPQSEYNLKIAEAKIALCSLSRRNRNESTGRSFEIPAIGGCLVAEDTLEHRYLFKAGYEAVLFAGAADLVEKCRALVANENLRRQVAESGHVRCMKLGLSWRHHIHREWTICERYLRDGVFSLDDADDTPFWAGFRRGNACQ